MDHGKALRSKDDFVAIDPGASAYQPGESAALCPRSGPRGKPLNNPELTVEGLIWKEGKIVATVPEPQPRVSRTLPRNTPPDVG